MKTNTMKTNTEQSTEPRANFRIYDLMSSGETRDIYAKSIEEARDLARAWIEAFDWADFIGGDYDGSDDDDIIAIRRVHSLDQCVGPIIYSADGAEDVDATAEAPREKCSGVYAEPAPKCPVEAGWKFVTVDEADLSEFSMLSHGGTATTYYEVCKNTGIYRETYDPGIQRNENQPLEKITYRVRDEASEEYVRALHADADGNIPVWLEEYLAE